MQEDNNIAQQEFDEFLSEMSDLINSGALRGRYDFQLWLEEVESECKYCFKELSEFVEKYIQQKFDSIKCSG
ncbi:MAG: hypothetical protein U9N53_07080 [Bacteroidota bacterium]|nr:hypothetical protein [Bacteroidota bacterium]